MECEFYTPKELAKLFNMSENSVYAAIRAGQIPCLRLGRLLRSPKAKIQRLIHGDDEGQGDHRDQDRSE